MVTERIKKRVSEAMAEPIKTVGTLAVIALILAGLALAIALGRS
jgi:hypothetical protein